MLVRAQARRGALASAAALTGRRSVAVATRATLSTGAAGAKGKGKGEDGAVEESPNAHGGLLPISVTQDTMVRWNNRLSERATDHVLREVGVDVAGPAREGQLADADGVLSSVPEEFRKNRTMRVYKYMKNACEDTVDGTKYWKVEPENVPTWTNQLMQWASSGDAVAGTGPRDLRFDHLEDAEGFCKRQGYKYYVEQPPLVVSTEGKKQYATNFLFYHVQERRSKLPTKQFKEQFAHPERLKPTWVNLKHSPFGKTPAKHVSKPHWVDEDHVAHHSAKDWYSTDIKFRQEVSRKVSK